MPSKKDFLDEQFGTNPLEDLGLNPDVVRQLDSTGGQDAIKAVAKSLQRAVSTVLHPDKLPDGSPTPDYFYKVTDAANAIEDASEKDLKDYTKAFTASKRRGKAATAQQLVYVDNPAHIELLSKASEDIISGRVVAQLLQRPLRFWVHPPASRNLLYGYDHQPGEPVRVINEATFVKNDEALVSRFVDTKDEYWWQAVQPIFEGEPNPRKIRGVRSTKTFIEKQILIDGTNPETGPVAYDNSNGTAVEVPVELLEGIEDLIVMSRSTDVTKITGTGDESSFSDIKGYGGIRITDRLDMPTGKRLLGSLDYKPYNKRVSESLNKLVTSAEEAEVLRDALMPAITFEGAGNSMLYRARHAEDYLNNVQRKQLVEFFCAGLSTLDHVIAVDVDTDRLAILGAAARRFSPKQQD